MKDFSGKKFFVYALALVAGIITVLYIIGRPSSTSDSLVFEQQLNAVNQIEIDTDNDGLKDWEEALWGTNKLLPDTDHDGTSDGDEIRAGRNPLIAPPDIGLPNLSNNANDETGGVTSEISQYIAEQYILAQEKGEELVFSEDTLASILEKIELDREPIEKYSLSDITLAEEDTPQSINKYNNTMLSVINSHSYPNFGDEATILINALGNDVSYTTKTKVARDLSKASNAYLSIADEVIKVPVPRSLSARHIEIVNVFEGLAESTQAMIPALKDPILAIPAINIYYDNADIIFQLERNL